MMNESTELADTLIELMEMTGPTGQEEPVLAWCRKRWSILGGEITVSPIGNVLARFRSDGPKLLLQGHADEIGFVVKAIDKNGFVWLTDGQIGSRNIAFRYPIGQPAKIIGRKCTVDGVFATATGHILSTKAGKGVQSPPGQNDVFVDIGAKSKVEAEQFGVHVGAGVIWNPSTRRLGTRIVGKAIDDRVSLALMTHLISSLERDQIRYDLTIAATVQEEIGLVGAAALGTDRGYDLAIAIDNGPTTDYPGVDRREIPIELGKGPVLAYKDSMVHYDRRIINQLIDVAADAEIDVQSCIFPGFGSDGAALVRAGIPTVLLAIASRYTHSPFEMLDVDDLDSTLALLRAFVTTPAPEMPPGPS